ncbi:MAG: class I SAM-dependent methyltransferase [Lachnospiraceae bacterium]|nr:class I SAM-dependent methyltransferase [Lachnospiraceae bacterium]
MEERIGKVVLNLDDYPGQDLYSDGEIEDVLLDIAMHTAPEDYNKVIAERADWAVLYHFSHIRTNILEFLPMTGSEKVLEIGSGCGAITGALAEKAGHVTCVELSKKRSLINAYRQKDKDNIEIRLGNFQDVEKKLPADYDVITLIGVLEYARNYIDSDEPFVDFLKQIKGHLKPGGRLVIAIENRMGMKYWAGATEDHSGRFFEGIEGYYGDSRAETFVRPELETIFKKAGLVAETWYYPFPDYKLPLVLYSDEYLPKKGELKNFISNFDRERLLLFDEGKALEKTVDAGLFPVFSNSYLVIVGGDES